MSSRLLDALDNSFPPFNPDSPQGPPLRQSSQAAHPSPDLSGSGLKKGTLQYARAVQLQQLQLGIESSTGDMQLLLNRPGSSKKNAGRKSLGAAGFQLHYDNETPVRSIDVGGEDQEQRMAEFVTKSIDNLSQGLTVKDAMKNLGLRDMKDLLPGLEIRLLAHQLIGVSWMLAQEKSEHKGGILADDMGLGKTVQMIAAMATNLPALNDECKTTLIVVPAALLQQWKDEIETKTNGIFSVHVHYGKDKLKRLSEIRSYDVIITSYQTLNIDFSIPKNVDADEELQWLSEHGGVLARSRYYRAVADEAQFIRNKSTRSSTSLAMVRAKYRWMLTGTPITNSLTDIYGLLRFGKFRPWNDWTDFDEYICKMQIDDPLLAGERAQAILKPVLLRRTKTSTLEGKPILQLPPKNIELVMLDFSHEERDLYNSFEKRTKIRLNKFIRERTLVKNHAAVLVMILRLRQLCCHPNLILSLADGYEDPTLLVGSDNDKELGRAIKLMGAPWVTEIKKRFLTRATATELLDFGDETGEADSTCPVCKDMFMNDSGRVLACGHEVCFDCTLDLSNSPIAHDGEFGHGNERQNLEVEKEYEAAVVKGYRPCPTCKKMMDLKSTKVFKSSAFEPSDEELTKYARSRRKPSKRSFVDDVDEAKSGDEGKDVEMGTLSSDVIELDDSDDDDLPDPSQIFNKRPSKRQKVESKRVDEDEDDDLLDLTMDSISVDVSARGKSKVRPWFGSGKTISDGPSDAVIAAWRKGDDDLEPSTKMLKLVKLLKEWDASGDKVICYSQWTSALDLIEKLFSRCGIQNLRYDGKMDRTARDTTLATFRRLGGPKVILISTKCGGVGLNLVSANRIVNMDLSWNYAAESQAYDRVHRLGQEKDVFVKRLVVRDTIEERMLQLHDLKVGLAEAALGEGTGTKLHKLSVKDIKHLFGMTPKTDEPGSQGNDEA